MRSNSILAVKSKNKDLLYFSWLCIFCITTTDGFSTLSIKILCKKVQLIPKKAISQKNKPEIRPTGGRNSENLTFGFATQKRLF